MAITKFNLRQGLKSSILLGWRIETNWANIFIVFLVKCSKPFAVALMLSAMYSIASGPNAEIKDLSWVIIGVCIWGFIQSAAELFARGCKGFPRHTERQELYREASEQAQEHVGGGRLASRCGKAKCSECGSVQRGTRLQVRCRSLGQTCRQ